MSLFSLITALLLEQFRPLGSRNKAILLFTRYANYLERQFNAGEYQQGVLAWLIAVLPLCIVIFTVYYFVMQLSPILGWMWNVLVLYLTMGFRHFSHAFTGISEALREDDLDKARRLLTDWTGQSASEMGAHEISRVAIEQGLIDSHRYVFGTIFWFTILPGPVGAIVYRFAIILHQKWGMREASEDTFGIFAAQAYQWLDWLPVRLTAVSFAIVGDFEDAVYCWRAQAHLWADQTYGLLLASGAGAIGVKLGNPLHQDQTVKFRPELGIGEEADPDYLQSAVGLIWRSVLLWLVIILLLSFANSVG